MSTEQDPRLPDDFARALKKDTDSIQSPDALDQLILAKANAKARARVQTTEQKNRRMRPWFWASGGAAIAAGLAVITLWLPSLQQDRRRAPMENGPMAVQESAQFDRIEEAESDQEPRKLNQATTMARQGSQPASSPRQSPAPQSPELLPPSDNARVQANGKITAEASSATRAADTPSSAPTAEEPVVGALADNVAPSERLASESNNRYKGLADAPEIEPVDCTQLSVPDAIAHQLAHLDQQAAAFHQPVASGEQAEANPVQKRKEMVLPEDVRTQLINERTRLNAELALWLQLPGSAQPTRWQQGWWKQYLEERDGTLYDRLEPTSHFNNICDK